MSSVTGKKIFFVLGEKSAYHSSFALAKALIKKGHEVYYLVAGMEGMLIKNNGFKFFLIQPKEKRRIVKGARQRIRYYHSYQKVVRRKIEKLIIQEKPDLCLLNALNMPLSLPFLKHNVPIVNYVNEFIHKFNFQIPPVFSSRIPSQKWYDGILNTMLWIQMYLKYLERKFKFNMYTYLLTRQYAIKNLNKEVSAYGVGYEFCEYGYRLSGRDYFAYPQELNLPGKKHKSDYVYGGSHMYKDRQDGSSFEIKGGAAKKYIYCSLGTWSIQHLKASERKYFYSQLIQAIKERSDLHLILNLPKKDNFIKSETLPKNVQIHDYVPQIKVLSKTNVFITHGGSSSIKEAVFHGVPMIVFPGAVDQPGNAARVVYHQLGVRGDFKKTDSDKFLSMIDGVLLDDQINVSMKKFQKIFEEQYECNRGVVFIENSMQ